MRLKTASKVLVLLAAVLLIATSAGCGSTAAQAHTARVGLNSYLKLAIAGRKAGKINDETFVALYRVGAVGQATVDEAQQRIARVKELELKPEERAKEIAALAGKADPLSIAKLARLKADALLTDEQRATAIDDESNALEAALAVADKTLTDLAAGVNGAWPAPGSTPAPPPPPATQPVIPDLPPPRDPEGDVPPPPPAE